MARDARLLVASLVLVVVTMAACASDERPEVVPGSTISTSSTTDSTATSSAGDSDPGDLDRGTTSSTSAPWLDPSDPDYPTTVPPPPPTESYPVTG